MRYGYFFALILCISCSSGGETVSLDSRIPDADASQSSDIARPPDVPLVDLQAPRGEIDSLSWDAADSTVETLDCDPAFGCDPTPCTDNADCEFGFCVEHIGAGICTPLCTEECPPGLHCAQLTDAVPDIIFVCVSDFATLCKPCGTQADCQVYGDDASCIDYGVAGAFCGGLCQEDGDCPNGFLCQDTTTLGGVATKECVKETGECPCTEYAIALQLSSACSITNPSGTCPGKRVCTADGLAPCDAAVPQEEVCNGLDDDCDGELDEDTCNDGNPCTSDSCTELDCQHTPVTGGSCDDLDVCTVADHCDEGICVGSPVLCNDDNPCTDDLCDITGGCNFVANSAACDDKDPCTVADQCSEGECLGTPVDCDCLTDADCVALDDGDLCTGVLLCNTDKVPLQCELASETVIACPPPEGPHAFCNVAACDPASASCSIVPANDGYACDDGNACTQGDLCLAGICAGDLATNCNDGNPCTDDACDPDSGCMNTNNTLACNDGDVCTTQDQCANGTCVGGPGLVCDDGNLCNGLEDCSSDTGCLPGKPLLCDDGNPCNGAEFCLPDTGCHVGETPLCNDGNPCTADSCLPDVGCQYLADDQLTCDDGNACTLTDHCSGGTCTYGNLLSCDDDNLCTNDSCDPATGCLHLLNTNPCDDGNVCTITDTCQLGDCVGSGELPCNDANPCTDDSCDGEAGCQFLPNQSPCNDGNLCTLTDLCQGGLCAGSNPPDCDDGNLCTADLCDPQNGCTYLPAEGPCDDGVECTQGDFCQGGTCQAGPDSLDCDDDNLCTDDTCNPDVGCIHVANVLPCDDGNVCTVGDACADAACLPGPDALDCSDEDDCSADWCTPEAGCQHGPADDGTACDDGNPCTGEDQCLSAVCAGTLEAGCNGPANCDGNPLPDGNTLVLTGTVNDTLLDEDPVIFVPPGAVLSGSVSLALTITDEGAPLPLVMVPNWQPHDTGFSAISEDPPVGTSEHSVLMNFAAPDEPGTYYLFFVATWAASSGAVASATDSAFFAPVWNNGMDVASWSNTHALAARTDGHLCAHWLDAGGLGSRAYLARVLTIVVDPVQNDVKVAFTQAQSIPGGYPYYLLNDKVALGDVREGPLDGDYDDYEVPWCNSWACCDSPSFDAYSIARQMVEPGKRYVIHLTGGDVGPAWLDGYIEVTPPWKVLSAEGSIGSEDAGANFVQTETKVTFHGGLSYGGCVCPDCGRFDFDVTVVRELAE